MENWLEGVFIVSWRNLFTQKDPANTILQDFIGDKSGHRSYGLEGAIQVELFKISLPEHWFELSCDLPAKRGDYINQNWMRNRNTMEFLSIWEQQSNPDLNSIEFDGIRKKAERALGVKPALVSCPF